MIRCDFCPNRAVLVVRWARATWWRRLARRAPQPWHTCAQHRLVPLADIVRRRDTPRHAPALEASR